MQHAPPITKSRVLPILALSTLFTTAAQPQPAFAAWIVTSSQASGHLIKLDTSSLTVLQSLPTDYSPDLAVSPDGTRLYLAATILTGNRDILQVIDSANGTVLQTVDNPDRFGKYGYFPPSDMVTSPDGRHLYILKRHSAKGVPDVTFVTAFDTSAFQFTSAATVGNCASSSLNTTSVRVTLVCGGANKIYSIALDSDGNLGAITPFNLPAPPPLLLTHEAHAKGDIRSIVWGAPPFVFLGRLDGTIWKVDTTDGTIVATSAGPIENHFIGDAGGAVSPDGRLLFMACDEISNRDGLQQIVATFDSTSLKLNAITKTAYRFNNVAASPSGSGLLLSVPSTGSIVSLSLHLTQLSTVSLGSTPHVMKWPSN